jgi:hypothetical protein
VIDDHAGGQRSAKRRSLGQWRWRLGPSPGASHYIGDHQGRDAENPGADVIEHLGTFLVFGVLPSELWGYLPCVLGILPSGFRSTSFGLIGTEGRTCANPFYERATFYIPR